MTEADIDEAGPIWLHEPDVSAVASWPEPPDDAAFHGVAGDLVDAVAEHTEADPVGVLGSILAVFGALAGRHKTFYQGSQQAPNVYVVIVGDSSTGRKGTALSLVSHIFTAAYPAWQSILVTGLGSGEGLIGHLTRGGAKDVPEHRVLVLETELGGLLGVMARDGSTLSPILRNAWDGVPLGRFLAREESLVLAHHVGCLAHVTPSELRDRLSSTDAANGFGNRFLWLAVRRTQLVPFPISPGPLVAPYLEALHRAIAEAQAPGELAFTPDAAARWEAFYTALAASTSYGLVGALTARAEAQVARLALVYALLDRSRVIDVVHLAAAEALWAYATRSARAIFGDSTGNATADYIRSLLSDGPMSREELRQATQVREAVKLNAAIQVLVGHGMATVTKGPSKGRGRRPDIVSLAAIPAIPPTAHVRVSGRKRTRPSVGIVGNGVGAFLQAPSDELQETQVINGASVSEEMAAIFGDADDAVEPDDVDRAVELAFPVPVGATPWPN